MSIKINPDKCAGCRQCIDICPGCLIKWDGVLRHAYMLHPKDCWGCASCVKVCPAGAIIYYLGADIGGTGTRMSVSYKGDLSIWKFTHPDGSEQVLEVDRRSSNQY